MGAWSAEFAMTGGPWSMLLPAGRVAWSPSAPHLYGDADVLASVRALLDGSTVDVTPVGPTVRAAESDPIAALWACSIVARGLPDAMFVGDVPDLSMGAPAGAVF